MSKRLKLSRPPVELVSGYAPCRSHRGERHGRNPRNRVAPLTVAALGTNLGLTHERLPPFLALFGRRQLRWTVAGILSLVCAQVSYFAISILLPKALFDQGAAVTLSFGLSSLVFMASIPGKGFTGFIMEIIGRR
jgi:hypothetical protein